MDLKKLLEFNRVIDPVRNSTAVETTLENGSYLGNKLCELLDDFYINAKNEITSDELYNNFLHALDAKKYNVSNIENDISKLCDIANFYQYKHKDVNNLGVTGLFISAAINKAADGRNEINLRLTAPLSCILYMSSDKKVNVYGKVGERLGESAENCQITAEEVEDYAGIWMNGGTLDVKKAGDYLGASAKNCNITAEEAGDNAGSWADNITLDVKKAGKRLGRMSHNTTVILDGRKKGLLWKILNQF